MSNRTPVMCPGCGKYMGAARVCYIEAIQKYETRLFCSCGWVAPSSNGLTEEEAIDNAFHCAALRHVYNSHLGDE